jgi:hypothetical protein
LVLDLQTLQRTRVITYGDTDSLVEKLNHAAFLIPVARHF